MYPQLLLKILAVVLAAICIPAAWAGNDPLWIHIRLAALPQQIELCRDLGPWSSMQLITEIDGDYEWIANINGVGKETSLSIWATDPADPYYFVHDCKPRLVDTASAMRAALRVGVMGPWQELPVSVDVANASLSVELDRSDLPGLSSTSTFAFSAWGIYEAGYATDHAPLLTFGAQLPAMLDTPRGDVHACRPAGAWCDWLDIVEVGISATQTLFAAPLEPSGTWYDRTHADHGINFHRIARDAALGDAYTLVFHTFNEAGEPTWYTARGHLTGNRFVPEHNAIGGTLSRMRWDGAERRAVLDERYSGDIGLDFNAAATASVCSGRGGNGPFAAMHWRIGDSANDWCIEPVADAPPLNPTNDGGI